MTDIKRSIRRAGYDDGLLELGVGLALLLVAGYFSMSGAVRTAVAWMPGLLPLLVVLAVQGLRRRFVYRRTGFAQPLRDVSWAGLVVVVAALALAGAVVVVTRRSVLGWQPGLGAIPWVVAFPVLAGAGLLASVALRAGRPRFWLHAIVLAAAAIVPAAMWLPTREHLFWAAFAPALTMLPAGIVTFTRFVRSHPVLEVQDGA